MEKTTEKYKLDPTLKWEFAEIFELNDLEIKFKLLNKKKEISGTISKDKIKWVLSKKIFQINLKLVT